MRPSASSIPGFSLPFGPYRSSFIAVPPRLRDRLMHQEHGQGKDSAWRARRAVRMSRCLRRGGALMRPLIALMLVITITGCTSRVTSQLAEFPGLQRQIEDFYAARAFEQNAQCTQPTMTATDVRIVDRTPERLVLDVRYAHEATRGGSGQFRCRGFGERRFQVALGPGGGTTVVAMTGLQR
jgi:hypothetical protein